MSTKGVVDMPSFEIEDSFDGVIAGVDEAGRGPWVGPVVAVFFEEETSIHPSNKNLRKANENSYIAGIFFIISKELVLIVGDAGNIESSFEGAHRAHFDALSCNKGFVFRNFLNIETLCTFNFFSALRCTAYFEFNFHK